MADSVYLVEMPMVRKVIEDETWLEGERRHCPVCQDDPVVVEHVIDVLLRVGEQMLHEAEGCLVCHCR